LKNFSRSIQDLPRNLQIVFAALLVLLLGVIDILTGKEISFSVFYLLPVYLVTWLTGKWPGIFISVLSAGTWLTADIFSHGHYSHSLIPVWNMLVRLIFFLITAYLLSELQRNANRRRTLEKIFFHDILNLTGTVRGFAELLMEEEVTPNKEIFAIIHQAAEKALDEIEAQQTLTNAEKSDLIVTRAPIDSKKILELVADLYRHHKVADGRKIEVDPDSENILFESDQTLLVRILGNLIKNALEATADGGTVRVGCGTTADRVCFRVYNQGVIPREIQKRIFREPISTKADGRGLGTYSIRILSKYLNGEASFSSAEKTGTTFRVSFPR
jgi:signal transduction histidine kinase